MDKCILILKCEDHVDKMIVRFMPREYENDMKKDPRILLKIKPFDWGIGTDKTSMEIDEILYGSA